MVVNVNTVSCKLLANWVGSAFFTIEHKVGGGSFPGIGSTIDDSSLDFRSIGDNCSFDFCSISDDNSFNFIVEGTDISFSFSGISFEGI